MFTSIGAAHDVKRVDVHVNAAGQLSCTLVGAEVAVALTEGEVGKVTHALEMRRIAGDGAVKSGENVLRLALADCLRTRGIDADEYAAGLAWIEARVPPQEIKLGPHCPPGPHGAHEWKNTYPAEPGWCSGWTVPTTP